MTEALTVAVWDNYRKVGKAAEYRLVGIWNSFLPPDFQTWKVVNSYHSLWEDNQKLAESDLEMFLSGQISAVVSGRLYPPQDMHGDSAVPRVLDMPETLLH